MNKRPIIKLSIYFLSGQDSTSGALYDLVLECSRIADASGFDAIWIPERHFEEFGAPYPNPSVLAAAIATQTQHISIRAGSVVLPLHHPIRVAEEWSMVDHLSGGRVGISVAPGWQPMDFILSDLKFEDRRDGLVHRLNKVRALWRGDIVDSIAIRPRPLQRELPVWMTSAKSVSTWETAATVGANVLTGLLELTEKELAERIRLYRDRRAHSEHAGAGIVTVMLHTYVDVHPDRVRSIVTPPMRQFLARYIDLYRNILPVRGTDVGFSHLSDDDADTIVDFAVERFFRERSLIGTPAECLAMRDRLSAIGVDEIACLINFGISNNHVIEGLLRLAKLIACQDAGSIV